MKKHHHCSTSSHNCTSWQTSSAPSRLGYLLGWQNANKPYCSYTSWALTWYFIMCTPLESVDCCLLVVSCFPAFIHQDISLFAYWESTAGWMLLFCWSWLLLILVLSLFRELRLGHDLCLCCSLVTKICIHHHSIVWPLLQFALDFFLSCGSNSTEDLALIFQIHTQWASITEPINWWFQSTLYYDKYPSVYRWLSNFIL